MAKITLKNSAVNGGVAVDMNAQNISYSWKNLAKANVSPGKYDLVEVNFTGIENPVQSIQGVIDASETGSNIINQRLLIDFCLAKTTPTYLGVACGNSIVAYVDGAINDSVTTIVVDDASKLSAKDYILIDDEIISITSIASETLTVVRAKTNTDGASHSDGAEVKLVSVFEGQPTAGFTVGGTMLDTIEVFPTNFNIKSDIQIKEGARINYSLGLLEDG